MAKLVKLRHCTSLWVDDALTFDGFRVVTVRPDDLVSDDIMLTPTEARTLSRALCRAALAVERLRRSDRKGGK